MRQQHKRYLSNLIKPQNNSNNLKRFWHYVKGKRQDNVGTAMIGACACIKESGK